MSNSCRKMTVNPNKANSYELSSSLMVTIILLVLPHPLPLQSVDGCGETYLDALDQKLSEMSNGEVEELYRMCDVALDFFLTGLPIPYDALGYLKSLISPNKTPVNNLEISIE